MAHAHDVPDSEHGHVRAADSHHGHDDHEHGIGIYVVVFVALMVLMGVTVGAAYLNMGIFNVPVAYAIASLKTALILWYFMHLNRSTRLTQVFAVASFAWLLIFLIMTLGDYISRGVIQRAERLTHIRKVDSYDQVSGVRKSNVSTVSPTDDIGVQRRDNPAGTTDHKSE